MKNRIEVDLDGFLVLLNERKRLTKRVDELQADNTRLVLENRKLRGLWMAGEGLEVKS